MDIAAFDFFRALAHDPLTLMLATGSLVLLWLHAALTKLRDRALFMQQLAAYGVPDERLDALAWALPLAELALAIALPSPWRSTAALAGAALLAVYAAAMAWQLAHGRRPDCGCGGAPLPLSWALVVRNLGLAGLALLAAQSASARPVGWADAAGAAAGVLLATLLYAGVNQVLRQAATLSERFHASPRRSA